MRVSLITVTGVFPDVTWINTQPRVVWADNANEGPIRFNDSALILVGSFPRINQSGLVIIRGGAAAGYPAQVINADGLLIWTSATGCGGNSPVAIGVDRFAWQALDYTTTIVLLSPVGTAIGQQAGRPTGLSHVTAAGQVILVDDVRTTVPGMIQPQWAGDLIVGESQGQARGVLCRLNGRDLVLWPDMDSFTPRAAAGPQGQYAVVTWGATGVRLAVISAADFAANPPPPDPPSPPSPPGHHPPAPPRPPMPPAIPDQTETLARAKADLLEAGYDLSGSCGAFRIVALAASRMPGGAGFKKKGGTNCHGFSIKSIMFPDGADYEVLVSPGTVNGPEWKFYAMSDPGIYAPASEHGFGADLYTPRGGGPPPPPPIPPGPPPAPPPPPPTIDLTPVIEKLEAIRIEVARTRAILEAAAARFGLRV